MINFDFDIYKTVLKNTIRFNTIYRSIGNGAPIHNYIYQGKIDRTVGYVPFSLNSNKLYMAGVEWIYHYKEMHYKIFYNDKDKSLEQLTDFDFESLQKQTAQVTRDTAKNIIELGADVNARSAAGCTALGIAAQEGALGAMEARLAAAPNRCSGADLVVPRSSS